MTQVLCRCECGTEKVVLLNDLRSGKTKTCGFNHPHYEERSVPAFNFMYDHAYKARAAARDLPFGLTKDQFRAITQMNCHYCGLSPSQSTVRSVMTGKFRSEYICNGISRVYHHVAATRSKNELIELFPPLPKVAPVNDNKQQVAEKAA
jgi:hypothetical protein